MLRVVVCDDNSSRLETWCEKIRSILQSEGPVDVTPVTGRSLADLVTALATVEQEVRRNVAANGITKLTGEQIRLMGIVNDAHLVILDSDLSPSPQDVDSLEEGDRENVQLVLRNEYGDSVARQMRAHSTCGLVVVINMFWSRHGNDRVFDLTRMQDQATFADMHLGEAELFDNSAWAIPTTNGGYAPWGRVPIRLAMNGVLESCAAIDDLSSDVLQCLELPFDQLLPGQLDVFPGMSIETASFEDLCKSPLGFRYVSDGYGEEATRRMAASVLRRWLNRLVIPAQNVLIDLPHLCSRYPQYLEYFSRELGMDGIVSATWENVEATYLSPALAQKVRPFANRVVFNLNEAKRLLPTLDGLTAQKELRQVFAEDTSRFVDESDAEVFTSDLPGKFSRLFVEVVDDVAYEPATRLLL